MSGGAERRGRQREESLTATPSITPAPTARAATFWTALICLLLTGAAVLDLVLTRNSTWHLLEASLSPPAFIVAMVGLFALCELALVHIEFRHEAYSISLAGIPLVLGALTGSATDLVLARVVGGLIGFAILRPPTMKAVYNASAYAFEAATIATAVHWLLPVGARLDVRTAITCLLVVAAVDVLMSLLVVLVIILHGSRLGFRDILQTFLPATIFSAANTTCALVAAVLIESGTLGVVLLAVTAAASAVMFKAYLVRRRRHQSLALIHEFVEQGAGLHSPQDLAARLLARMQTLLRCTEVELVLASSDDPAAPTTRLRTSDDGDLIVEDGVPVSADWLLLRVVATNEAVLLPRTTTDPGMRDWLAARGTRDALVVPMPGAGQELALIVTGRLGEAMSFTKDDVTLTRTLFGHLAVALHGTRVVEQLRHDARHDALTGLPNRALLGEALAEALRRERSACAVLLLDLDRFKEVNDALGHHVGDELLQVVANRLRGAVPPSSVVARLGGDEFAILLRAADNALIEAQQVASRIVGALSEPVQLADALVSTGASIGIALPARGLTDSDMLRHADTAMYAAKAAGKPVLYTDELDRGRSERLVMLADLHVALERDELELLYQPQLDFQTGEIVAAEALVRWRHPRLGVLTPDAFIPLAESTGLIHPLTDVVLRKALRQAKDWLDAGRDLTVAVNMSARTVDAGLPDKIAAALAESGLPARNLVLEITESAVMDDPDRAVPTLRRVADLGVELSLDDFGTGYSSLSYLQRLPVQEVKIDRSFVFGLVGPTSSYTSAGLIRSIITIGEHLGLRVVAEGVENAGVLEVLRSLGCDLAQGYHIGRPGTSEQLMALLDSLPEEAAPAARPRALRSVANQ
ncbi:MAG: putative bifunctional diguanylate cyclase/phosphodiesterase [Actinomycetales bacterium]